MRNAAIVAATEGTLAKGGVRLQLRRGQRVTLEGGSQPFLYRIEQGCLICEVALPAGDRHIVLVLFAGDYMSRDMLAALPSMKLSAAMPSVVTRLPPPAGEERARQPRDVAAAFSRLLSRSCLYATAMGRLTAEERFATLIADIALHLGKPTAGGYVFDLPLTRRDMADHLALNPDSLSRLMSRFRTRGLLTMPTRSRAIARDIDALLATTPFGPTLRRMWSEGRSLVDGA